MEKDNWLIRMAFFKSQDLRLSKTIFIDSLYNIDLRRIIINVTKTLENRKKKIAELDIYLILNLITTIHFLRFWSESVLKIF